MSVARSLFPVAFILVFIMLLGGCNSDSELSNAGSNNGQFQSAQKPNGGGEGNFQPGSKPKTANPNILPKLNVGSHSYGVVDLVEFTPQEYAQNGITKELLSNYINLLKKRDDCQSYIQRLTDKLNDLDSISNSSSK
jgi:hypothetical protein